MKIILANPPWKVGSRSGVRAGSRWPHLKTEQEGDYLPFPFFMCYSAALLKKNKMNAKAIDAIAEGISEEEFIARVKHEAEGEKKVLFFMEASTPSLENDLRIAARVKRDTNALVAVSGPDINITGAEFLKKNLFVDFVLFGEYEFTLLELAKAIEAKPSLKNLKSIPGLMFRPGRALGAASGTAVIKNEKRALCNIDLLPWPERNDVPAKKYLDSPGEMPLPCGQMTASRGCPFSCTFCAWPQIMYNGSNYRARNPSDVASEMEYMVKKLGFRSIYFDDDTFNVGKERIIALAREIKKRKIGVPWAIMARADLMDDEILREMKSAGLWAVKYGVESGSQKIVDSCKKNLDIAKAKKMILLTKSLGIKTHLTFAFGLPGESKETISETRNFLFETEPFTAQFSIATPFPGTIFYEQMKKSGRIISDKWSSFDGSSKSVISTEKMSGAELESACAGIKKEWEAHVIKRDSNCQKFSRAARQKGIKYALSRSLNRIKSSVFRITGPKKQGSSISAKAQIQAQGAQKAQGFTPNFNFRERFSGCSALLVMSPPWGLFPPLGISYIAAYLEEKGLKAGVLDLNLELNLSSNEEDRKLWHADAYPFWVDKELFAKILKKFDNSIDRYVSAILETEIKVIGFSVHISNRQFAAEVARRIKDKDPRRIIVFGGIGTFTSHDREECIAPGTGDLFVVGEGEETFYDIVRNADENKPLDKIPGAVFYGKKKFSKLIPRAFVKNLDSLPFPKFNEINLALYPIADEALPLVFSRGCISRCAFCNDHNIEGPFRIRSADNMFAEIKYHVETNRVLNFYFNDLLINGNVKILEKFCDLLIESGYKISWSAQAIPKFFDFNLLCKMRKSGCFALIFGLESASNKVLKQMGKLFTEEEAEKIVRETHDAGIKSIINIIVGFPGETEEDFKETVNFVKRNAKNMHMISSLNTLCINLNSELDGHKKKYGLIMTDDEGTRASTWKTISGENYETRLRRGKELLNLCASLGLSVYTTNVPRDIVKKPN